MIETKYIVYPIFLPNIQFLQKKKNNKERKNYQKSLFKIFILFYATHFVTRVSRKKSNFSKLEFQADNLSDV